MKHPADWVEVRGDFKISGIGEKPSDEALAEMVRPRTAEENESIERWWTLTDEERIAEGLARRARIAPTKK